MYIVDAHVHLGLKKFIGKVDEERLKLPAFQYPVENTIENQLAVMDSTGIAKAVVFPFPFKEIDYGKANSYVLEAARRYPDRFIPFGLLSNKTEAVKSWINKGLKGFKHHILYRDKPVSYFKKVYRLLETYRLPLIIHASYGDKVQDVENILKIAPKLKIILAHAGRMRPGFGQGVLETICSLKDSENLYFETSTVRESSVIRKSISIAGAHRIIFGSDFPFGQVDEENVVENEKEIVLKAIITENEQTLIFSENILRIIPI